jgi:hypothetical protein
MLYDLNARYKGSREEGELYDVGYWTRGSGFAHYLASSVKVLFLSLSC